MSDEKSKLVVRNVVNDASNSSCVTWTDIAISDDSGSPINKCVKSISMSVSSGDLATLIIEEYVLGSDGKVMFTSAEDSNPHNYIPLTKKTSYTIAGFKIVTANELKP